MTILLKTFAKIEDDKTLPNLFCKATITVISKLDRLYREIKLQTSNFGKHRCKKSSKNY